MPGFYTVQPAAYGSFEEGQTKQKEAPAPKSAVEIIYTSPEVWSILLFELLRWCELNRIYSA